MRDNLKILVAILFLSFMVSSVVAQTKDSESEKKETEKEKEKRPLTIDGKRLSVWMKELTHSDPSIRVNAVKKLPEFGQHGAIAAKYLGERLGLDRDVSLRANIALAMNQMFVRVEDVPEVVKDLSRRLTSVESQTIVRYYAAKALGRFEEDASPAIGRLIGASKDSGSWEIRHEAVKSLSRIGTKVKGEALDAIIAALSDSTANDHCSKVRLVGVEGLQKIGEAAESTQKTAVIDALKNKLEDKDPTVAIAAYYGLMKVNGVTQAYLDALAKFLKAKTVTARTHAINRLGMLGVDAKPKIADMVKTLDDPEPVVINMACIALGDLGLKIKFDPSIARKLREVSARKEIGIGIRQEIVLALKKIEEQKQPDKEEANKLKTMWEDYFKNTKPVVGSQRVVKLAGKELTTWTSELLNKDPYVRENAVRTAQHFLSDARDFVPNLITLMRKDRDVSVRVQIARTLKAIEIANRDLDDVIKILKARLRGDNQAIVRFFCADALGRFGEDARDAIPELILATRDAGSFEIRQAAILSLANIAQVEKDGEEDPEDRVIRALASRLRDRCVKIRLAATMGLGALNANKNRPTGAKVAKELIGVIKTEKNPEVSIWARLGLMAMDQVTDEQLESMAKYLKYKRPETRASAIRAFGLLGAKAKDHIEDIVAGLKDDSSLVVSTSCWALGQIGLTYDPGKKAKESLQKIADDTDQEQYLRELAKTAIKKINGEIKEDPEKR